ncbi:MAG: succinylglutamate desuccinylase/aspartoacylase family protein, partial [Bryobacteraceae bacterium]
GLGIGQMKFDFGSLAPGSKTRTLLDVPTSSSVISVPVLAVRGSGDGPTLLVTAGVHGDEYEGVRAIFDVFESLDPAEMKGNFLAVPVMNPPAFWNISRTSPLDNANLARVFPGSAAGTATEAIAFHFDQHILPLADFYIDLHSGGVKCAMPTLIGYLESDAAAAAAAEIFGAPVIWCHPNVPPGRTLSAAVDRGIPCLYAEARGAGRIHAADLDCYRRGVMNILRHLGILSCEPHIPAIAVTRLFGDGNVDVSVVSPLRGFLIPSVALLDPVVQGQPLGILVDITGAEIETFAAPSDGIVVLIHECPLIQPDEPLFLITRPM